MIKTRAMIKRARWLWVLMLAMLLAATLLPSLADAHSGINDVHATGVAEGESSLFGYDPPGPEPGQEYWFDAMVGVNHKIENGLDYYQATYKFNSLKGVFIDDDSIWAPPGDYQPADIEARLVLFRYNHETEVLTQLHSVRGWYSPGKFAWGCWGSADWVQVNPDIMRSVVARLWVRADRKYWDGFRWVNSPTWQRKWHGTSSHKLGTVTLNPDPGQHWSLTHIWEPDPLTHHWVQFDPVPGTTAWGTCPNFTPAPQ